ncbi:MAG TPA: c-type cytochrome [Chloroflexota bacterium]
MAATHTQSEEHHPSASGYAKVATVLFILTIFEVAVFYIEPLRVLGLFVPILLVLSVLKFCGIGGWYMHLRMDHKLFFVFFASGVVLALAVTLTLEALFNQLIEPGKPINSISTQLAIQQARAAGKPQEPAPAVGAAAPVPSAPAAASAPAQVLPHIDPKTIGNVELGREFWILKGCSGCHVAPGIPNGGQIGPNQAHFQDRPTIAGGVLPNTPEAVERWLKDPPAAKPGTLMPNLSLTNDQIKDLTAFLYSLP